jgi:hypothetical protein
MIDLVGAFIKKKPLNTFAANIDWDALFALATTQSITPVLAYMARRLPPGQHLSKEVATKLETAYQQALMRSTQIEYASQRIWDALNKAQIPHVPMKGSVTRDFWPVPEFRTMSDVDILIHSEYHQRVYGIMKSLGYARVYQGGHMWNYHHPQTNIHFEIHNKLLYLLKNDGTLDELPNVWGNAAPKDAGLYTYSLSFEFNTVLLTTHIAKHLARQGCGVRLVADLIFWLEQAKSFDVDLLFRLMKSVELLEFFLFLLGYCREVFDIELKEFPDSPEEPKEKYDFFSGELLGGSVHGNAKNHFMSRYLNKTESGSHGGFCRTLRFLWKSVFPAPKSMYAKGGFLRRFPFLLLFAYIYRLFHVLFSKNGHKSLKRTHDGLKYISGRNVDEATARKAFHQEIGLLK